MVSAQTLERYVMSLPKSSYQPYKEEKLLHGLHEDNAYIFTKPARYVTSESFLDALPYEHQKTYSDVAYLQIVGFTFLLGIWFLPQRQSQWEHGKIERKNPIRSWSENVQDGPVRDNDKWWINYIGHSVVGAYYYTLARNNGMSVWESSFFNFMMSTFYWEYGVEAMFEIPSSQDLWITPVLGSILGEGFYQLHLLIVENDGKVFGSTAVGSFFMTLFNPEGALADFLRVEKDRVDIELVSYFSSYNQATSVTAIAPILKPLWMESYLGLNIKVKF